PPQGAVAPVTGRPAGARLRLRRVAIALGVMARRIAVRSHTPRAAVATKKPRLVLCIAVDQMWFDYLDRFAPLYTGGLKRLREEGAVFTHALYQHANSETGPGHAVLLSGRHARDNGIVANAWYDRLAGTTVNVVDDPANAAAPRPRPRPAAA